MAIGALFDMDGVLVASGPAHMASWRMALKKYGITVSDETFRGSFGRTSREIIRTLWGEQVSDDEAHRIEDEKESIYRNLIDGMVPLMIGCRELLSTFAAAGFSQAVATSGPPQNLELVLKQTGIGPYFRATVTGRDVHKGKPAPDVFLLAAERLAIEPAMCVVIEDAPVGIEAAHAAGMCAIGLAGTHPAARLEEARADRVVDHLADISAAMIRDLVASR